MENSTHTLKSHMLQYGLLLAGISLVFNLMLFFLDMHYQGGLDQLLVFVMIMLAVIMVAQYNFRKTNSGFMSLGQSVKLGLGLTLIHIVVALLYFVLLVTVMDTDTIDKMNEVQLIQMSEYSFVTDEIIEQAREEIENTSFSGHLQNSLISIIGINLFISLVLSFISGLILKRNRPE